MHQRLTSVLAVGLIGLAACGSSPNKIASDKRNTIVAAGKALVSKDFLDPASAQYRGLKVDGGMLCGEVNAKNTFGAYTGFGKFWAQGDSAQQRKSLEKFDGDLSSFTGQTGGANEILAGFDRLFEACQRDGVTVA